MVGKIVKAEVYAVKVQKSPIQQMLIIKTLIKE